MNDPGISAAAATPSVRTAGEIAHTGALDQRRLTIGTRLETLRGVAGLRAAAETRWEQAKRRKRDALEKLTADVDQLYAEHTDLLAREEAARAEIKGLEAELARMDEQEKAAAPVEGGG